MIANHAFDQDQTKLILLSLNNTEITKQEIDQIVEKYYDGTKIYETHSFINHLLKTYHLSYYYN